MEINAGAWYLRGLRSDSGYVWEVCEPTTGEVVAEVRLDPVAATVSSRAREGQDDAAAAALRAVYRFAETALGITVRD